MSEKDNVILQKIVKYCNKVDEILKEFHSDKKIYMDNTTYQLATDMCIYQVGELSIHVSDNFKKSHLELPWAEMRGMRNIHAHEYDNVNREEMWNTLIDDIPQLKSKIEKYLAK